MKTDQKIRYLTWAVVILGVLNLSVIMSIAYHVWAERNQMESRQEKSSGSLSGREIIDVMDFTQEQKDQFHSMNGSFRESIRSINLTLDENRSNLFAELKKSVVDTVRCNYISAEIGNLHKALKIKTYRFYLDVKGICTPEQQLRLNEMFSPLFSEEKGSRFKHGRSPHHRFHGHN